MKTSIALIICLVLCVSSSIAGTYEVPPSDSTSASVSVISDEAMEQCVKIYNEAKWLAQELNNTRINEYDAASVNTYNAKVQNHSLMTKKFNANCAGKQSASAYKAAQKLNQ